MKVRGWEMFLAGILSRPESWADTPPAGPLTFHLTILLSQSRPEKFPSTNKQSESFLFISPGKERENQKCFLLHLDLSFLTC